MARRPWVWLPAIIALLVGAMSASAGNVTSATSAVADSFGYPAAFNPTDRDPLKRSNRPYDAQNAALTGKSSCFGVTIAQLWHSGEDWFGTATTPISAVASGVVVYSSRQTGVTNKGKPVYGGTTSYPGGVVIIDHTLPDGTHIWSMYGHLDPDKILVGLNASVSLGQRIADGLVPQTYKTNGGVVDNTHLHWEMRYFADASGIKAAPKYTQSCSGAPGPGYTYPGHPDSFVANAGAGPTYRWTNPSAFVAAHLPGPTPTPTPTPTPSPPATTTAAVYYEPQGGGVGNALLGTADGGFVIAGSANLSMSAAWLVKLRPDLSVEWSNTYGMPNSSWSARAVGPTSSGGYLVAGCGQTDGSTFFTWVAKVDGQGVVEWQRQFGTTATMCPGTVDEASDGGITVIGYSSAFSQFGDVFVMKLDAAGGLASMSSAVFSSLGGATPLADGSHAIWGLLGASSWIADVSADGQFGWQHTFNFGSSGNSGGTVRSIPGGIVTGGQTDGAAHVRTFDSTGALVRDTRFYPDPPPGLFQTWSADDMVATDDGGLVAAGWANAAPVGPWVAKTDASGNLVWQQAFTYGYSGTMYPIHIAARTGGYVVMAPSNPHGALAVLLLKLDATGHLESQCSLDAPSSLAATQVTAVAQPGNAALSPRTVTDTGGTLVAGAANLSVTTACP